MHSHLINASFQLLPIVSGSKHPYEWVDEVIHLIEQSGVKYDIGPFSTSVESDYKSVMSLIDKINSTLVTAKCPEWILSVQFQLRADADMTAKEKIDKFFN